ncbi:MAG: glycosyltransferase family 2 protein [Gemmatimonadaceae bacterium]
MADQPAFSIVVPLFNEEENVRLLVDRVRESLAGQSAWELLLVDDGSTDGTALVATEIARIDARVRVIRLARNFGQTSAMQAGFDHAAGRIVVSMDGDLQNDPRDIPLLIRKVEEGFDLVAAYRVHRQDKLLTRKVPSWIANRLIRGVTGVPIRDNGCSLKAYRRELLDRVHLYSDMHRFIPAVAAATAGARIAEIPVRHHARRFGRSKYGLSRVAKVFADLLAIKMIRSFRERPLTLFGIGAAMAMLIAFAFAVAAATGAVMFPAPIADAIVLPGAALLWFGLAFYLLMLGLIAEAALRRLHDRDPRPLPLVREAA